MLMTKNLSSLSEDEFRRRLREKYNSLNYERFEIGDNASFDDLFMSRKDPRRILAIMEYKTDGKYNSTSSEKEYSQITDIQMNYALKNNTWKERIIFIILIRQPKTLSIIKELFSVVPRKGNNYLILIVRNGSIEHYIRHPNLYFSRKRFKKVQDNELIKKGKVIFCQTLNCVISELKNIFEELEENTNSVIELESKASIVSNDRSPFILSSLKKSFIDISKNKDNIIYFGFLTSLIVDNFKIKLDEDEFREFLEGLSLKMRCDTPIAPFKYEKIKVLKEKVFIKTLYNYQYGVSKIIIENDGYTWGYTYIEEPTLEKKDSYASRHKPENLREKYNKSLVLDTSTITIVLLTWLRFINDLFSFLNFNRNCKINFYIYSNKDKALYLMPLPYMANSPEIDIECEFHFSNLTQETTIYSIYREIINKFLNFFDFKVKDKPDIIERFFEKQFKINFPKVFKNLNLTNV